MKKYTLNELADFMDKRDFDKLTIDDVDLEAYLESKLNEKKDLLDLDKE